MDKRSKYEKKNLLLANHLEETQASCPAAPRVWLRLQNLSSALNRMNLDLHTHTPHQSQTLCVIHSASESSHGVTCDADAHPEGVHEEGGELSHRHVLAGRQEASFVEHRQDHEVTAQTSLGHKQMHRFT